MIARILAIVGALGMIFGAYVFRYGMPGDGGDGDGSNGGSGDDRAGAVICARELGAVCDAIDGATVEPAAVTADRLVGAAANVDVAAWITPGPWAEMVDTARGSRPPLFAGADTVASSPIVLVSRKAAPIAACASAVSWKCLGDAAQDGASRLAADPDTTPTGLFVRAAATGGFVGNADYATNDLDEVPGASDWLTNLDRTLDRAGSFGAGSLERYLAAPASAQGFLTTAAAARAAAGSPTFAVATPTPGARVDVLLSFRPDREGSVDLEALRDALREAGWDVQSPAGDDGLPSAGVLVALRGRLG